MLCPRRYSIPSYKNTKLPAQFVSTHSGPVVYKKHLTWLCQTMQEEVEREAKRA